MSSQDSALAPPLLRGYLHLAGAMVAPFALIHLIYVADTPGAVVGAAVFGVSLILLYATSAMYHILPWSATLRPLVRRLDHSMIFVFIGGVYTPFALMLMSKQLSISVLLVVWGFAGVGVVLKLSALKTPHWVSIGLYFTMGWLAIVPAVKVASTAPIEVVILPAVAGVMCSIGTAIYLTQWPNPFPRVFGYHELFHTLVIISTAMLSAVLAIYVLPT